MTEPKTTTHHVTMPLDKAAEYLSKIHAIVNEFADPGFVIALSMAERALLAPPTPSNEALTVEELRGMGGEPVWVEEINPQVWRKGECARGWVLVCWDYLHSIAHSGHLGAVFIHADYGKAWLAYRRPPLKEE